MARGEVVQSVFLDGKLTNEKCPEAARVCSKKRCGKTPLEMEYGFCPYGLGMFWRCVKCCAVYDFREDQK